MIVKKDFTDEKRPIQVEEKIQPRKRTTRVRESDADDERARQKRTTTRKSMRRAACKDNRDIKRRGSISGTSVRRYAERETYINVEGRRNSPREGRDGHSDKRRGDKNSGKS